jgi:quinol monooxygenase YgiN
MMSDAKQAIHVIAEAIAKPGQEDALYRTLHACVAPTRAEPGNRGYILHQDLDNAARFFLYETWVSREALNEHFTTPHFKTLDNDAKPLVGRELSIAVLRAFDEAGLLGSG